MRRIAALGALVALVTALALPAGAATTKSTDFVLSGEARGLEVAIGDQGVTLGFAKSLVDSTPKAIGIGAGQCALLGAEGDPSSLCAAENTVTTAYPGNGGDGAEVCTAGMPAPLNEILDLRVACGASKTVFRKGIATTTNSGKVASLSAKLPVGVKLVPIDLSTEQVQEVVTTLTDVLAPVLDLTPQVVQDTLQGAQDTAFETVDGLLEVIQSLDATDALKVELGTSTSKVAHSGDMLESVSEAAGAKIGLIGVPSVKTDGSILEEADPLKNGLVIIEVGTARASASVDRNTAKSGAAASPALVTVKVRDITSPTPKYVEVSVAPGQTVTLLEGTPAESTIVAADSETIQEAGKASAVAKAVELHLLKGVNGGVKLALAGASAAADAKITEEVSPVTPQKRAPKVLPLTGARDMTLVALVLLIAATGALAVRRRFNG